MFADSDVPQWRSSPGRKTRWLFERFLRLDLMNLREGEKHDIDLDAVNFAGCEETSFRRRFPKLVSLQGQISRGLECLWAGKTWRLPPSPAMELEPKEIEGRRRIFGLYLGSFERNFLLAAVDEIIRAWSTLRRCAYRQCRNFFIPSGRQIYCSHQCTKKENWARFAPRRQRDYKAEFASRYGERKKRPARARW
jgi:hypothetical protein